MRVHAPECRFCAAPLTHEVVDLGMSPPCESFVAAGRPRPGAKPSIPCGCWSATSAGWCSCASMSAPRRSSAANMPISRRSRPAGWSMRATTATAMRDRLGLGPDSLVVELASNDGYLLQHFLPLGVPVLGIEPAPNVAAKAVEHRRADPRRVLRARARRPAGGRGPRGRPDRRQQRAGAGARPERFRRRASPAC